MNEDLFLIYVNNLGVNFMGKNILEFIFSNELNNIDGEDWDAIPASSRPRPPYENFIKKIGTLECEIDFEFIQDSTCFSVWDSMDGVVAIAYEDLSNYETYPDNRLVFNFGETIQSITSKLYERDLILVEKNNSNE